MTTASIPRRRFLGGAASLLALGVSPQAIADEVGRPVSPRRPRTLVHVLLVGGFDAVLTTNPKRASEVDARVDVPYQEADIVEGNGLRLGPLFRRMARYAPRMAIINGVVGSTVAHQIGAVNTQEMRRAFPVGARIGLTGTLGAIRGADTPLSDVRFDVEAPLLGRSLAIAPSAPSSPNVLGYLHRVATDDATWRTVDRTLAAESAHLEHAAARVPVETTRALLTRLRGTALDSPTQIRTSKGDPMPQWSTIWRDTLFVLQHRLAPCVFIKAPDTVRLDSHQRNLENQTNTVDYFVSALCWFLDELGQRKTIDGASLADEVGLVFSSELGRFPVKNEYDGKDHFPEFPAVLVGPGLRPGQYGETDRRMASVPISWQSGHPASGPREATPTIDDLGATILRWFGVDDTRSLGYAGRPLDFVLA